MAGSPLAIDIETIGVEWQSLHPSIQAYLIDRARTDEEREAVPARLGLNPGTGRVVAIGMWRPREQRGGVLSEDGGTATTSQWVEWDDHSSIYRGTERTILAEFWRYVRHESVSTIITFNGRRFDGPFLMIRSAMLGIAPSRNLVPYRYSFKSHCDLVDVLSFYGARPMESLQFWTHQFGVVTSKDDMDGSQVAEAYRQGQHDRIARYCLQDARATAELFLRLEPLIQVVDGQ